jgi:uncharacterized membrane protein YeaQ/YmgE (transglycosylase-associated protein family)
MDKKLKIALGWILDFVLGYVGYTLLGEVSKLFSNPTSNGIIGLLSIIGATALTVILIMSMLRKRTSIEAYFTHLTVHYDGKSNKPEFITNNKTKQAYWVSEILTPYVRKHSIPTHRHKKGQIQTYCKEQEITLNERDPLPSELGLRYRMDKTLTWTYSKMNTDFLNKLSGKKLDDLKVVFLYPWYYYFISTKMRELPNKSLLLKISTKEAFEPPRITMDLIEKDIIPSQILILKPRESLKKFAKRYDGYTYNRRCFTENALLKEAEKSD